jgi:hypothetical protein
MKDLRELLDRKGAADGELSPIAGTFLRGLSLGALVGAAIAGSALWRRVREARDEGDVAAKRTGPASEG